MSSPSLNENDKMNDKPKAKHILPAGCRYLSFGCLICIVFMVTCTTVSFISHPFTPLHEAARDGDVEKAKALIAAGADVNAYSGMTLKTPLHTVVRWSENLELAELLILSGAYVNLDDFEGNTALDFVVYDTKNEKMEELLRQYGATD